MEFPREHGMSNDSDSDSDSYYDRMMAAAAEEDDKIEEGGGEAYPPLEDLSDEQYYAAQANQYTIFIWYPVSTNDFNSYTRDFPAGDPAPGPARAPAF